MLNDLEGDDNPEITGIMPHVGRRFFHLYRHWQEKFDEAGPRRRYVVDEDA
jgi:hypothetical protein